MVSVGDRIQTNPANPSSSSQKQVIHGETAAEGVSQLTLLGLNRKELCVTPEWTEIAGRFNKFFKANPEQDSPSPKTYKDVLLKSSPFRFILFELQSQIPVGKS